MSLPSISPVAVAFVVAKEKGYYREEGLEPEFVVMRAAAAIQALLGGDVYFSTAGGASLPAILRGAPLRFLFTAFNRPTFWLYARPDIRSIEELKGKKVGVSSFGSAPDLLLRDLLQKHGMRGGTEVTILAIGEGEARYFALKAGSVDAAMIGLPAYLRTKDDGFRELYSFFRQEDLVELQGSAVTRTQIFESEPNLLEKFLRGALKGLFYIREKRQETVASLARFMKTKNETAAKFYDLIRPGMTQDGTIDEQKQKKSMEHVWERVGLKSPPAVDKVFDFSLVRKLNLELRSQGWRPRE